MKVLINQKKPMGSGMEHRARLGTRMQCLIVGE